MKKIANSIHHTHWDLIWYFTTQDATVQLSYNMKELLRGFKEGKINNFFFDGQTTPFDEYLSMYPEDRDYIETLVKEGKLVIGPFNSQLDCFITSGESVLNNLKLGFKTGDSLGKTSKIAYLPDSFGHSLDFPKIFNQFDIHDFIIKRGVGDEYNVDSEFIWKSKDGSEVLVFTMMAGYGYGCYAFKEKTLFTDEAVDYNHIKVDDLIERITDYSSLENDFVFLLGFDQNPAIMNVNELIEYHNNNQDKYEFVETTWDAYLQKIRDSKVPLKTHTHEIFSTQYHRVHRSIFSARADIKGLQDKVERILTYQLQPYMSLLDTLGIPYNTGLVEKAWETLILCQTHSSANLTDETNAFILQQTKNAYNLANTTIEYLNKLVSISLEDKTVNPLLIVNPLPYTRSKTVETTIYTKQKEFSIIDLDGNPLSYTLKNTERKNNGVLRKDVNLINKEKYYYTHDIVIYLEDLKPLSYVVYNVIETMESIVLGVSSQEYLIENDYYRLYKDENGLVLDSKEQNISIKNFIYLENSGDEGDSFDYSYPTNDWILTDTFKNADVKFIDYNSKKTMIVEGEFSLPYNLEERADGILSQKSSYHIELTLNKGDDIIDINGYINNSSIDQRTRLVFKGSDEFNANSYAGTQYGYIERSTDHPHLKDWKENGWFEEPSTTFPLLNHVSIVSNSYCVNVFTKSSKEYQFIGELYNEIAVCLFRSYGTLGSPDLNRRPGRPGGLDYTVFKTEETQMIGDNYFHLGLNISESFNGNIVRNKYIDYVGDIMIHHQQNFDKSIKAIQYFPTNPWWDTLPLSHSFLDLDKFEGSFGSMVKEPKGYNLRIFNNIDEEIEFKYSITNSLGTFTIEETNMLGEFYKPFDNKLGPDALKILNLRKEK